MKRDGISLAILFGALTLASNAPAGRPDTSASPYNGIVARNVFDVHPAPPHDPEADKPPAPPPPKIVLNGITDILHKKQVLLKVQVPSKPPAPPKEEPMVLAEGQREGQIEILEIDIKAGTVKINDYGTITNLSLEANSEKLVSGPPAGGVPGQPAIPNMASPVPPPSMMPTLPSGRLPPRAMRLPGNAGSNQGNSGFGGGTASTGGFGGYGQSVANNAESQASEMSEEQLSLSLAAQKARMEQEGNPMSQIIPMPPSMTKALNGGSLNGPQRGE